MDFSRLKQLNDDQLQKQAIKKREVEQDLANLSLQETVVKSIARLTEFLDGKVSKTVVVNQLKEIATPDVEKVVDAVDNLHETLKTHENTDLSEVTSALKAILEEAKQLPKELPDLPQPIDHSEHFATLAKRLTDVEKAIRDQELHVEAPVVNLPETQVNVEAPDLTPLEKSNKKLLEAVKAIVIPEYTPTDVTEIVKEQKKSNVYLKKILDKPVASGGGGGGRATPYENSSGIPQFVTLYGNAIPYINQPLALRKFTSGDTLYLAESVPGTDQSSPLWRIQKIDGSGNIYWKEGSADFIYTANNLTDVSTGTFI